MARYQKAPDPLPAVKSIQTGRFAGVASGSGTGEDRSGFVDITITPVDPARSVADITTLSVTGSFSNANTAYVRFLSSTVIRVSGQPAGNGMDFRWRVVEYN